jgi:Putative DNA-binding domain
VADTTEFAAGLLDPQHPVPVLVKGRSSRRYGVYRNNVTVGLIRALEANFPVVRKLLGEDYFAGFARDYAQNNPPQSPLMFQYGQTFPHALENAEDLALYPYLGDVARLEILWRESYHAADAKPLPREALAAIEPEILFACRLNAHPATRLLQSHFAIHAIFAANSADTEGQAFDPGQPQSVLITRSQYEVAVHSVTPDQFAFFHALIVGNTMTEALDHAASLNPEFDLANALALLLRSGVFHSIQHDNETTT